jgi:NhaP-type Na+/H+ or K+/H+ antiporter
LHAGHREFFLEIVYFSLVGIGLYFGTDALLRFLERRRGEPFKHRDIIFFVIILAAAMASFEMIQYLMRSDP